MAFDEGPLGNDLAASKAHRKPFEAAAEALHGFRDPTG